MKILSASVINFGSYDELTFEFNNQGLVLLQGATGAGKSTICDIVPWILFGKTAKNGQVTDVVSWKRNGDTSGKIKVETDSGLIIEVSRLRDWSHNDLYFVKYENDIVSKHIRGFGISDTQNLINEALGLTVETYLASAYFHELSDIASFFTTSAKNRRDICEQLIDLSFITNLQANTAVLLKQSEKHLEDLFFTVNQAYDQYSKYQFDYTGLSKKADQWNVNNTQKYNAYTKRSQNFTEEQAEIIENLKNKSIAFEKDRNTKLQELNNSIHIYERKIKDESSLILNLEQLNQAKACDKCGTPLNTRAVLALEQEIKDSKRARKEIERCEKEIQVAFALENPYTAQVKTEETRKNTYAEEAELILKETDPFAASLKDAEEAVKYARARLEREEEARFAESTQLGDLYLLSQSLEVCRIKKSETVIFQLETTTNAYLTNYFDGEIKINFIPARSDRIEIDIFKDGNLCNYAQLSKGQRQLLKFCFSMAVMQQVANTSGVKSNCIFLDEALDGLDDHLKVKAYYLLKSLEQSYESIFVVEHSEALKALFDKRFTVVLTDGISTLHEES